MKKFFLIAAVIFTAIFGIFCLTSEKNAFLQENIDAFASIDKKGTLYGNSAGTEFCCAPGTKLCGAADCPFN